MSIFSVLLLIIAVFQTALFVLALFSVVGDPVSFGIFMLVCWAVFISSTSVGKR